MSRIASTSTKVSVLDFLPDQAVRLAIGEYENSGNINYGPVTASTKNRTYEVVLDYISADVVQLPVIVHRYFFENEEKPITIPVFDDSL